MRLCAEDYLIGRAPAAEDRTCRRPEAGAPGGHIAPRRLPYGIRGFLQYGGGKRQAQVIGAALELDASQAAAFWPVYKQYEAEFAKIGDARYAGIKSYAANYGTLTDAKANELIDLALGLEEQRLALIKRYLGEFRKVLPGVKAARWYQAEMGLNRIVDIRLAAELPLMK